MIQVRFLQAFVSKSVHQNKQLSFEQFIDSNIIPKAIEICKENLEKYPNYWLHPMNKLSGKQKDNKPPMSNNKMMSFNTQSILRVPFEFLARIGSSNYDFNKLVWH